MGMNFRIQAIERTLREHTNEIAGQKLLLGEVVKNVEARVDADKILTARLDVSFDQTKAKIEEIEKKRDTDQLEVKSLLSRIAAKVDQIALEHDALVKFVGMPEGNQNNAPSPGWKPAPAWSGPQSPPPRTLNYQISSPLDGATSEPQPQQPRNVVPDSGPNFGLGNNAFTSQPPIGQNNVYGNTYAAQDASFGRWAPGAGTQLKPFEEREWSTGNKKVTKQLDAFDGDIVHYDNWRRRIRDHFIDVNCNYAEVFRLIENEKGIISWANLPHMKIQSLPHMNWQWIASHLWSFMGQYMTDNVLNDRLVHTCGEEFNGLELWRQLFLQHCGGSTELKVTERGFFIAYPKCSQPEDLQQHLGQWVQLKLKYGSNLPEDHLIQMFHNILPDDVVSDLKQQRDIKDNLQRQIAHVYAEMGRFTDGKLSKWNLSKLKQNLKSKTKGTTGIHAVGTDQDCPPPPIPDAASLNANIERMVNAAFTRRDQRGRDTGRTPPRSRESSAGSQKGKPMLRNRIPNPRFKGCWCCGKEGHSRQNCPEFIAIKKKNGGKIPKDYKGAYERSMMDVDKPSAKVAAVATAPSCVEHAETVPLWPMLSMSRQTPTKTSNSFQRLIPDYNDERDEEDEVCQALAQLTSNVSKLSEKGSQRERKKSVLSTRLAHLVSVSEKVKSGEIELPDLDLENDEEYMCVWALVDSGAGVNVADSSQIPGSTPTTAPEINLTCADGNRMPNKGARKVMTHTREGISRERTFYDAPVDMPILSVAELSAEGDLGSEVDFKKHAGYIEDVATGDRQHFVKRLGVYFMRLYFKRHPGNDEQLTPFARPGR